MKPLNDLLKEMLTWGTPACGVFCGVLGILLAILLLTIGFWKTLFVALLCAVGVDKASFLKNLINKLFPPKE